MPIAPYVVIPCSSSYSIIVKIGSSISIICNSHEYSVGKSIVHPQQFQSKVFDRFFRVPTGNRHDVKGYGLGLSYVSDMVRQHGGRIMLRSVNEETVFTVYLPLAP